MLDKLFGKKKEKKYFLEIEEKPTIQENEPAEVVSEEATTKEMTTEPEVTTAPKVEKEKTVAKSTKSTKSTKTNVKKASSKSVSYDPPEWVKAIKNYSNTDSNQGNGSAAKAGYLRVSAPKPSRRPGPSLNRFKQMANTLKK